MSTKKKSAAKKAAEAQWELEMAAMDKIDTRVEEYVGESNLIDYSAYKSGPDDMPIDNLDEVAVVGKVRFHAERDEFYGGKSSRTYQSPVLENPTWLELCKHANAMMLATNDRHHCFLEGVEITGKEGDIQLAEFSMGS